MEHQGSQAASRQIVQAYIEYAVVALNLSGKQITDIVTKAGGVDATMPDLLRGLKPSQLEAIWKRLSEDPRWRKSLNDS
jgi:hypothetical protein